MSRDSMKSEEKSTNKLKQQQNTNINNLEFADFANSYLYIFIFLNNTFVKIVFMPRTTDLSGF